MDQGKIVQAIILSALSLLSFAWNRYRAKKNSGKEIGIGCLTGIHTPYKYVYGVTNYTLSNITMILICHQDKSYILMTFYIINTIINLYIEIKSTSKIWNKAFIYENGIKINYEFIPNKKMIKIENTEKHIVKYTIKEGLEVLYDGNAR